MTTVEGIGKDLGVNTFGSLDALNDIKAATRFDVVPGLAAITAVTGQRSQIVINVGAVNGEADFVDRVSTILSQKFALQS